jgi:hypothetical protein
VREDAARMTITEPCGVDNAVVVADAFDNRYVPALRSHRSALARAARRDELHGY